MRWMILLLFLTGCSSYQVPDQDLSRKVIYTATCNSGVMDITIENENGGVSQFSDVSSPWTYAFTSEIYKFVYISAQNQQSSGTITTEIKVNGIVWKNGISSGAYVISTSSGSLE